MKVLATAWHGGGVNAIAPVIKELIRRRHEVTVIAHEDISINIFGKNDISHEIWLSDVSVASMKKLVSERKPNLVLTGTVDRAGGILKGDVIDQTVTIAAKHCKIKTLAILDSYVNCVERFSDSETGETFSFLPDKIAITDEITFQIMKKEGFDSPLLEITGNPFFDNLSIKAGNFTEDQKQSIRKQIGLGDVDFLIFCAGNVFKNEAKATGYWDLDIVKIIIDAMSLISEVNVGTVIKLHPRISEKDRMAISPYLGDKMKSVRDFDSQYLSLASDLTVTSFSTVGIEAVHMNKPCLSLQLGLKLKEDPFLVSANGIIPVGYDQESCLVQLRKMITEPNYRKVWARKALLFKNDGKATERIVDLIHKMLKGKQ